MMEFFCVSSPGIFLLPFLILESHSDSLLLHLDTNLDYGE